LYENNTLLNDFSTKQEFFAKIQEVQAKISQIIRKTYDDDQKEGMRIAKEYHPRKMRMDLEFYLTAVLGVTTAEKFFYRYSTTKTSF